jgi:hypothetical protein
MDPIYTDTILLERLGKSVFMGVKEADLRKIGKKTAKPLLVRERLRVKQCKRVGYFTTTTFCVGMVPILTRYTPEAGTSKRVL